MFFITKVNAQFTTNLPIVIITTPGAIGGNQIQGTMNIINNVSGVNSPLDPPTFTGMIGIEQRGNLAYSKISYTVETWSTPGISLDTSLLGMPSDNDWVLTGNYPDRSLMRSNLAYFIHDKMGRYAPRNVYCELIVNNQYSGIYDFGETVKRGAGRLDIAKLTVNDNNGNNLTGGYIWKIDDGNGAGWTSAFAPPYAATQTIDFQYVYPKNSDITSPQKAYIKSYVDSFETEMNSANFQDTLIGWRKHGAVNSFIDFILVQELSRNNEAYRQNNYFYKDKGTKLRPGALWGFDLAWKNTSNCNSSLDTGWCYNYGGACPSEVKLPPFWWQKLTTDVEFMKELKCRYTDFRKPGNVLDTVQIFKTIDSISTKLNANGAITRNFTQWPIWGIPIMNEPTPMANDYTTEIANLKSFIKNRLAWIDTKWISANCAWPLYIDTKNIEQLVSIYPIPAYEEIHVNISDAQTQIYSIIMYDIQGVAVSNIEQAAINNTLNVSTLAKGIYFLHIQSNNANMVKKIVVE